MGFYDYTDDEFDLEDALLLEEIAARKLGQRGELFDRIYAALLEALEDVEAEVVREAAGLACDCVGAIA